MEEMKNHGKKWLYFLALGTALIIIYKLLDNFNGVVGAIGNFFNIISPLFAGIFISYLLYMPCKKIEKTFMKSKKKTIRKNARKLSILTVYAIIIILIVILINFILPVIFNSIIDFISNIQGYIEVTIQRYNRLPEDSFLKSEIVENAVKYLQEIDIKEYINLDKIMKYVMNAISAVTSIVNVFIAIIVSIYILIDRTKILTFLKRLTSAIFKEKTYKNIDRYFNNSNEIFFKFIASQFLDAIIVGILVTIAMSIMGIKYAPLLGFFIGLFNMIPYVGAIIAVGISAIITLITGGLSQAIWMLIVVTILQQIDANIIAPKIIGNSLKISPLLVLLSIIIGKAYFGIIGMFLAVPVVAVIKILVEEFIDYKMKMRHEGQV